VVKNQISSLAIDITKYGKTIPRQDENEIIFNQIFTMFTNLKYLNFGPSSLFLQRLLFSTSPSTIFSSTLLELHVCLFSFNDCLYLLDGRFDQLRVFYVHISWIEFSSRLTSHRTVICFP